MPIHDLPENKTRSGIKTHSTTGGEGQNFNELRFEDKKGHEEILIHAERAMSTVVEAGQSLSVGASRSVTVAANESVAIGTDPKGDPHATEKSPTTVFGDTSFTVSKGDYTFTVAEGTSGTKVKGGVLVQYGSGWEVYTELLIRLESLTKHIELVAAEAIRFTTGASSIEMKKDGTITVTGKVVTIIGSESVTVKPAAINLNGGPIVVTGEKIDIAAGGNTAISGALVKINC